MKRIKYFVIYLIVIIGLFYIGDFFVQSENSPNRYTNDEYVDTFPTLDREVESEQIKTGDEGNLQDTDLSNDNISVNEELIEAELVYVVDGDTIKVNVNGTELKVRFIGINTPESVHADESKNNEYGNMASDYTKQLLSGIDTVYLQYDEGHQDQYGRELCYVWVSIEVDFDNYEDVSQYMINAIILEAGYAVDVMYEPNKKYEEYFALCSDMAKKNQSGLWQYSEYYGMVD